MRRDLLVTAILFTMVGFVAGALFTGSLGGDRPPRPAPSPAPAANTGGAAGGPLPADHPPMGETGQQFQALKEKAEQNPDDAEALIQYANFLYDQGVWDQAVRWYERAVRLAPDNADVRTDYATSLYMVQLFDDSVREYQTVLAAEPDKAQALFGLARVQLEGKGDRAAAQETYRRLKAAHPTFEGLSDLESRLAATQPGQ